MNTAADGWEFDYPCNYYILKNALPAQSYFNVYTTLSK